MPEGTARHTLTGKSFKHAIVFEQDFPQAREKQAPPRAVAIGIQAYCAASATTGTTGQPPSTIRATITLACACISTRRYSLPATRSIGATVFSCVASRNKQKRSTPRPGLPRRERLRRGRVVVRRHLRVQLLVIGERQQRGVLGFQRDAPLFQLRVPSWLRFSVALPLGINGAFGHSEMTAFTLYRCESGAREQSGVEAASKKRCASLPRRGVRPARLFESQKFSPKHRPHSACRPLPRGASRLGDEAGGPKGRNSQEQSITHSSARSSSAPPPPVPSGTPK